MHLRMMTQSFRLELLNLMPYLCQHPWTPFSAQRNSLKSIWNLPWRKPSSYLLSRNDHATARTKGKRSNSSSQLEPPHAVFNCVDAISEGMRDPRRWLGPFKVIPLSIKTKLETLSSFPQLPLGAGHCLQLYDALVAIVSLRILCLLAHRQCDTYSSPSGLGPWP